METSHLRPLVLWLVLLGGCGGGAPLILPGDGEPAAIDVVRGDSQSGRVSQPLADPVVVQVTDSRGRPVEGASVAFAFTDAGPGADVIPQTTETNSDGLADAQLVLGTSVGLQTGQARVVTAQGKAPITTIFRATALSENANSMAAVAGEDQTGHVGQPLDDRLVVEVTDGFGNPVPGVPISWSAEGGGSVSAASVTTGDDGRARVERILGPTVGPQSTVAESEGLAGSPVVFAHTAIAGNASRLVIVSGNEQTAAAGSALPADLVVRLVDANGNGVPRAGLSWVVATGAGSASPENTATDDDGQALTQWTLGATLGEQRIDAVVSGTGFVSFKANATAGAPASLFIRTQPSSTAQNGVPFARQPVLQLRDSRGNDVALAGILVRASLSGGGELRGTLAIAPDAAGRASFTDLAISGDAGARTLFFEAEGYAGAISNEVNVAAAPNRAPLASFTSNCVNLACSFNSEASSDPDGSIVTWTWTLGDGGSDNARNPSHSYSAAGTYQVTLTVTDDDGAPHSVTHGVTVTTPGPDNREPFADFNWHCEGLTCHFTDASSDRDGIITNRHWDFGDGATLENELNPSHTYAAAGRYTLNLTVTDNGGLTSVSHDDLDPQAQTLEIRRQPSNSAASGVPFDRQPEIRLRAGGRDVRQAGVVVSASIASGTGTLGGTPTATTDQDGRAQFADLSISGTGSFTLKFTAPGFGETTSNTVDLGRASSTTTITEVSPEPSIAGSVVTVKFAVSSGVGPTPTGTVTVKVTGSNPPAPCTVTLTDGAGTCQFTLNVVGDRVFTATYSGDEIHGGSEAQAPHRVDPVPPPPNQAPTATFTSDCTDLTCVFNSAGSNDPDGSIQGYSWTFGDGGTSDQANPSHPYSTAGTYTVTLTVTDNQGATGQDVHQVTVTAPPPPNQAPTASFTPSCAGLTCSFDGSASSDPEDVTVSTWSWDFGDGFTDNLQNTSHTFATAGDYTVKLTVTDHQGANGTASQTVTVTAPPAPAEVRTSNR